MSPSAVSLRAPAVVLLLALALVLGLQPAAPADAAIDRSAEQDFACRTNELRAQEGRAPLRIASDLTRVARAHSVRMADNNHLHHNPNLGTDVRDWRVLGENVGRGPSVHAIHEALVRSDGHRRNLLDARYTEVGIGVERRGSTVWVTQVFRQPRSATTAPLPDCGGTSVLSSSSPSKGVPVAGDWNGDGRVTPGVFRDGSWELSFTVSGKTDLVVDYGRPGDLPIVGDWNGDGKDTLGIVRDGTWHLRNSLSGGRSDISFAYGRVSRGDVPIAGDWNGNGRDGIGIIRDGQWHLRNSLSGGPSDFSFHYGRITRGDVPLVGDWNGDGRDTIGIVRKGEWHLRNVLSGGPGQTVFTYGRVLRGDVPVIGDWNRDGLAGVGIVRGREWHLRNSLSGGPAQITFTR